MSCITVSFLDKEYSIPADVTTYVGLVDFTNAIRDNLVAAFNKQIAHDIGILEKDDFMVKSINDQVSKFISKLLDNDIYDKTIGDYLRDSKGYDLFFDTKKRVIHQIISIRKEKLETYRSGVQDAINKKEASVTGLDFGIISGSFVNHMIYAYMDASKQTKQEQEALKTYRSEIAELDKTAEAYDHQENDYIKNNVIPAMNTVFTYFSFELLDRYISDLIRVGKFDKAALSFINLERSNDLLENLDLANNKRAVIESAFTACPFNIAVYMNALKHELLDFNSFQTAKVFNQDGKILSFFEENWGEVVFPTKFNIDYYCINILASLTGKSSIELLHGLTERYATSIVKAYSRVADMLNDKRLCRKVLGNCNEDEILTGDTISKTKAYSFVHPIVSSTIWSQLTEKCGHFDLLDRLKKCVPSLVDTLTKDEFDKNLVKYLFSAFENERRILVTEILSQRKTDAARKAEQQRKEHEHKKRTRRVAAIITTVIVAVAIFFIVLNTVIIPSNKYNEAIILNDAGDFNAAIDAFASINGYKDSDERIKECQYALAAELYNKGNYNDAKDILLSIPDYKGANRLIGDCYMWIGDYQSAIAAYGTTDIIIPDGISHIKAEAFKGCENLTSITIPASVTRVGKGAFDDCESLVDVHISDLTKWCQIQFEDLTSSPMLYGDNLYLNSELLTDIVVPDNLTQINEYAFASWECLVNVKIGDNITDIDSWAFAFCDNLKNVTLPGTITSIKESTFNGCNSLTDIVIPKNVESICEDAFRDCNTLINVVVPGNVKSISESAFAHCDNLTTFSFPDGIKTIAGYMFYPCESLQTVKVPNSVNSIGKWAFRNCLKLTSIEFNGTINEWKAINKEEEWDYEIGQYTVYCTDGQISAAQNAIFECEAGDVITFGTYEQDGNSNNGTEAIEWIVLKRDGDKALVISNYCLEQMPFNETLKSVTWENCTLRKWMNSTFISEAFSNKEQSKILSTVIDNVGNDTTDKVFLLSESEATDYFESDSDRRTTATDYVSTNHCYWFLRTPGNDGPWVHFVEYTGELGYTENVDRQWWVRPAMWIKINE